MEITNSTNTSSESSSQTSAYVTDSLASAGFVTLGAITGALSRWRIQVAFGAINIQYTKWSTLGINVLGSLILGEYYQILIRYRNDQQFYCISNFCTIFSYTQVV